MATEFELWDCDRVAGHDAAVENGPWHRVANGSSRTEIPFSSVEVVHGAREKPHTPRATSVRFLCGPRPRRAWVDPCVYGWMEGCCASPSPRRLTGTYGSTRVYSKFVFPGASIPARTKWCRFGLLDRVARLWKVSTRKPTELGRPILAQLPGHSIQRARLLPPPPTTERPYLQNTRRWPGRRKLPRTHPTTSCNTERPPGQHLRGQTQCHDPAPSYPVYTVHATSARHSHPQTEWITNPIARMVSK